MQFSLQTLLLAAGFASSASAHMSLFKPTPFKPISDVPNAPLDPSGSNYPCKIGTGSYNGPVTTMEIGSSQSLTLQGGATHGGGSCQISITKDFPPTKNSVFKVIHSIQGECPVRNQEGNAGNDATVIAPDQYAFKIPQVPAGKYTFAWTWFNKIGNREMYMECAAVEISGPGGSQATFDSLPEIFKANIKGIGADTCTTNEKKDVVFPNPGQSIEINKGDFKGTINGECGASGGAPPPSGDRSPEPTKLPGGVFVTVPTSAAAAPTTVVAAPPTPPVTTSVAIVTVVPVPTQVASPAAPPATGGGVQSGPCSPEGFWNCIGGTSFQRCASGSWSVPQPLAAGTSCTPGISANIKIGPIGSKRAVNFRA